VLPVCPRGLTAQREVGLDEAAREAWRAPGDAVARKTVADERAEPYEGLTLVSLVGLNDPPRAEIRDNGPRSSRGRTGVGLRRGRLSRPRKRNPPYHWSACVGRMFWFIRNRLVGS
jgi:hypothetical protein